MLPYRRTMFLSGIALVPVPVIERIFLMQAIHVVITIGFRQDGSRRNGQILSVSFYNGRMGQILILMKTVPIDQQMFRTDFQLVDGSMHGQERGLQYIDFVNFFRSNDTNRPSYRFTFNHLTQ